MDKIIDAFRERRRTKVENWVKSSPHSVQTAFAVAHRQMKVSEKVGENAVGSAASKANLMRDSDALLTLVGSIIHMVLLCRTFKHNRTASVN